MSDKADQAEREIEAVRATKRGKKGKRPAEPGFFSEEIPAKQEATVSHSVVVKDTKLVSFAICLQHMINRANLLNVTFRDEEIPYIFANGRPASAEEWHKKRVEYRKANGWEFGAYFNQTEKKDPTICDFEGLHGSEKLRLQVLIAGIGEIEDVLNGR